jgi:HEAT repeat protein
MKHVFISYAHNDNDFAEVLKTKLSESGIVAWLDQDRLEMGDDWRLSIDNALRGAFACIVILSPEADASKYVTYEWAFACGLGLKVLPILYRECDNLHPRLEIWQYKDFTPRTDRPWNELIARLQEIQKENLNASSVVSSSGRESHVHGAMQALTDWKPADRAEAAKVLGDLKEKQAIDGLLSAINDNEVNVRITAIQSLGKIADKRATEPLLELIDDKDTEIRNAIIIALAKLKDSKALPHILQIVKNETNTDVRLSAARALVPLATKAELKELVTLIEAEQHSSIRVQLINALATVDASYSIPTLIDCLADVPEVRNMAESVLLKLDFTDFEDHIEYGLCHGVSVVGSRVAYIAGEFLQTTINPLLLGYLEDPSTDVNTRKELAYALGKTGDPDVIPDLIKILRSHDPDSIEDDDELIDRENDEFYRVMLEALDQLATPEYIDDLVALLYKSSWVVREQTAQILGNIDGLSLRHGLPDLLITYIRDDDEDVQQAALLALTKQEHMADIETILSALSGNDFSPNYFSAKQEAVDFVANHFGVRGLLAALSIESCSALWEIAEKIIEIFQPENKRSLLKALKDSFHRVRGFTAEALGQIGKPEYCEPLKPLVDDQHNYIRGITLRALGRLGCTSAREQIISRLDDESKVFSNEISTVSDYAAIALGQIGDETAHNHLINVISYRSSIGQPALAFEASQLLAKLSHSSQTQVLQTLLDSEKWETRFGVVEILGKVASKVNDPDIVLTLGEQFRIETDDDIRVGIAQVLSDNVDDNAIPILIEMLEDTSFSQIHGTNLDIVAVRCLNNIDDLKAQEAVQQWSKNHPDRDMKQNYPYQNGTDPTTNVNDIPF